jgi:hypothetical protein
MLYHDHGVTSRKEHQHAIRRSLMPRALEDYGSLAVCNDEPGTAMRAVAEKLAARGFGVRSPEWEESRRLTITGAGRARCELTVEDGGSVRWDYRPGSGPGTDPAEMTALVLRVLGAAGAGEPRTRARPGVSLKGVVGRALAARGLKVGMQVFEDPDFYAVSAEIVVSSPARPERGQVSVSDDGDLTWECRYYDDDTAQIADAVAGIVTDGIGELHREARASTSMRAACCASQGSMSGEYR